MTTVSCAACGSPAVGKFCSHCGAALGPQSCGRCQAALSPGARYCHRCGQEVGAGTPGTPAPPAAPRPGPDRTPWLVAGVSIAVLLGVIGYTVGKNSSPRPAPDMANPGAAAAGAPAGAPPDISQMSPRERFDRLFDRVMSAAEQGDTATVVRFSPMALGAYEQLDAYDADARYHAAMIHLALGQVPQARALADTILAQNPNHLFGFIIKAQAATQENRQEEVRQDYATFLRHYPDEIKAGREEYQQHRPVLEGFKQQAEAAAKGGGTGKH